MRWISQAIVFSPRSAAAIMVSEGGGIRGQTYAPKDKEGSYEKGERSRPESRMGNESVPSLYAYLLN